MIDTESGVLLQAHEQAGRHANDAARPVARPRERRKTLWALVAGLGSAVLILGVAGSLLLRSAPVPARAGSVHGTAHVLIGRVMMAIVSVLQAAEVRVTSSNGTVVKTTTTDRSGDFRLSLPPGTYRLSVSCFGQTWSDPVRVQVSSDSMTIANDLRCYSF